jgi:glycosyltransferase involved in cell wall biosynthesis
MARAIPSFDVIHVHGLYRFPPTIAASISRWFGVPFVIQPHGSLDPYLYDKSTLNKPRLKRVYERCFDLPNLNAAAAIHYTAEEERDRASFLQLRSPSFVIPNGVEWGRFRELPTRGELRGRWGVGDAPIILFLGRLHRKKGLDLLIPAFAAIRQLEPNVQLVIAGPENDDYGRTVREWVTERGLNSSVHFVGPLYGIDVVRAFVDADVFVLPSYTENFGVAVVEAMACALPVVISDQVNIHAEISSAGAGLVTRCDAEDVAAALLALLGDADRRHIMGTSGRKLAQERYAWPSIVDALTKEYAKLLEPSGV